MNIRETVNGSKVFVKDSNIFQVPSKYNDDEVKEIFFEYLTSAKSLDYEFRSNIKEKMNQETISSDLYSLYYKVNATYDIEVVAKCAQGVNVEIIKSNFSKLIADNFPALIDKKEDKYDESKRTLDINVQNSVIKEYYQDTQTKEIVSVYEQNNQLTELTDSKVKLIGLVLKKPDLLKRIKQDITSQVKDIIKKNFHSYDYKITKIKLNNIELSSITYILIPYTQYLIDSQYYALVNRVNGKVLLDYTNMSMAGEVKYRMLELVGLDKFNTNLIFSFYFLLAGGGLFYPLMWLSDNLSIGLNKFIALAITFAIGSILGLYRSVKYALKNKLTLQDMAMLYEKGDSQGIKQKKKDKKAMLITLNIVALIIAIILIVLGFSHFS